MKKFFKISAFAASLAVLSLPAFTAEFDTDILAKPHRIFEIGVDSNTAIANNLLGLKDIKKDIVIDLRKIADDMRGSGFNLGFMNQERYFMNLNISSRFRFGVFAEVEATTHLNISDDLFDLLGSGIKVGDTKTVDVTAYADVFANIGASFQTIISGYGIKITPTYCVPLVYAPRTRATGRLITNKDGLIRAEAEANVDIYTAVDMQGFIEDDESLDVNVADILSNGGFDLTLDVDRNWFHGFNAGLYTRIPIVAGTLNYKMHTRAWMDYEVDNLLDSVLSDDLPDFEKPEYEDFTYSKDTYKAYRPLKLGLSASYSPFGQWFKIQPSVGFAVRNPYSGDAVFYPEYALDLQLSLLKRIFNFNFGTAYQSQIFQQRFGFSLNFRALEILARASLCGTSFKACFNHDGYGVLVGVRVGF